MLLESWLSALNLKHLRRFCLAKTDVPPRHMGPLDAELPSFPFHSYSDPHMHRPSPPLLPGPIIKKKAAPGRPLATTLTFAYIEDSLSAFTTTWGGPHAAHAGPLHGRSARAATLVRRSSCFVSAHPPRLWICLLLSRRMTQVRSSIPAPWPPLISGSPESVGLWSCAMFPEIEASPPARLVALLNIHLPRSVFHFYGGAMAHAALIQRQGRPCA
jgi:hypothetical protein